MNDSLFSSFFNMLLDFPVPDFAHNEFESLRAFLPDDIPNVVFVASLATTSFYHDFGRQFPASCFFLLHNLLASLPANTPTAALRLRYYAATLFTVNVGAVANAVIKPAHLFGRLVQTAVGSQPHTNWLNERFDALVNAMAIRAVNQNNMVGPIPFPEFAHANLAAYNPYTFLVSLTHDSYHSISAATKNLSSWTLSALPASRPLRAYLQAGSSELGSYLSCPVAMPTWNTTAIAAAPGDGANPFDGAAVQLTSAQVAAHCNYLTARVLPAAADLDGINVFNVANPRAAAAPPANPYYPVIISGNARPAPWVDPISYIEFETSHHVTPNMQIFAPYVVSLGALGPVIISGKIIELGDILVISVHVPTPRTGLFLENARYTEGAIRISRTRNALFDNINWTSVQYVPRTSNNNFASTFLRGTTLGSRVPVPSVGVFRALVSAAATFLATRRLFPGSEIVEHAGDSFEVASVFGAPLNEDFDLNVAHHFNVWSSFRYEHRTPQGNHVHVFPSLRHIFGTRAHVYATEHPAHRVPF